MRSIVMAAALALLGCVPGLQAQTGGSPEKTPDKSPTTPKTPFEVNGKSLAQWREMLKSTDPSRRSLAIMSIMQFGEDSALAVGDMIQIMDKDPDVSPRVKAVNALRYMDVRSEDVERVVRALTRRINRGEGGESQAIVRLEALITLRRFTPDAGFAILTLKKACFDPFSWEIRHQAVTNLWRIAGEQGIKGDGADPGVVATLLDVVKAKNSAFDVKVEALTGLTFLGKPIDPAIQARLVTELDAIARGPSVGRESVPAKILQLWALAALSNMGENAAGMVSSPQTKLASFLRSKELELKQQAAVALGTLGKRATKQIPALVAMLDDPEPRAVAAACQAILTIGEKNDQVVDKLVSMLESKRQENVIAAAQTLVAMRERSKKVMDALDKQIERKDRDIKEDLQLFLKAARRELEKPDPKKT
jgi:hypothetical protein